MLISRTTLCVNHALIGNRAFLAPFVSKRFRPDRKRPQPSIHAALSSHYSSHHSPLHLCRTMRPAFATLAARLSLRPSFSPQSTLRSPLRPPPLYVPFIRMCASSPPTDDTVMNTVHSKISAEFAPTRLVVTPTYGDPNGSHVSITVVSDLFEGLTPVKRHQAVYKAIWEELSVCHHIPRPFFTCPH